MEHVKEKCRFWRCLLGKGTRAIGKEFDRVVCHSRIVQKHEIFDHQHFLVLLIKNKKHFLALSKKQKSRVGRPPILSFILVRFGINTHRLRQYCFSSYIYIYIVETFTFIVDQVREKSQLYILGQNWLYYVYMDSILELTCSHNINARANWL